MKFNIFVFAIKLSLTLSLNQFIDVRTKCALATQCSLSDLADVSELE